MAETTTNTQQKNLLLHTAIALSVMYTVGDQLPYNQKHIKQRVMKGDGGAAASPSGQQEYFSTTKYQGRGSLHRPLPLLDMDNTYCNCEADH